MPKEGILKFLGQEAQKLEKRTEDYTANLAMVLKTVEQAQNEN